MIPDVISQDLIPQEKSAAVVCGLREAFGVTEFEDIRPLNRGLHGALVFRILVGGIPFLLRIITRAEDPARHFANMRAAAEAGLAPRVCYTSVEDKIAITDFLDSVPFPLADARRLMPAVLRATHALPPFATIPNHINTSCTFFLNQGPALDGFLRMFQAANLLPKNDIEELLTLHAQLAAIYALQEPDMVSSHNDLKPENICFDGHRIWLVDWEAAFLNDRYSDLAVIANFAVTNEAEERVYLEQYFGQAPNEYQLARFFLMRQVSHLFYAMGYMLIGSGWRPTAGAGGSGEAVNLNEGVPEFGDFHRQIWGGEIDLGDNRMKTVYGRVHWEQLLKNVQDPRFDESIRIVSGRHACA